MLPEPPRPAPLRSDQGFGTLHALFALGVMSIGWMVLIGVLIAFEKLLPWDVIPSGATAALLVVLGVAVVFLPDAVPGLTIPMNTMSMDA